MTNFVVPHDPNWPNAFETEARLISTALGDGAIALHHIGSTAIVGILAKPIIDMLGIVADLDRLDIETVKLEAMGFEAMGTFGIEGRRYFRKINESRQRTHHLHVFAEGSAHIERHLAFRDYLRDHPDVAADYSNLKASLTLEGPLSWDSYIDGKDPFIKTTEEKAVRWYREHRAASDD